MTEFFNRELDLSKFERSRLSFIKSYFITREFEYRIYLLKIVSLSLFWILYFSFLFCGFIALILMKATLLSAFFLSFSIWPFANMFVIFKKFYKKKAQYLKISRGGPEFLFGDGSDEIKTYQKEKIVKIMTYSNKHTRSPNLFEIIEVIFSDDTSIIFTNGLISSFEFSLKFSDKWKFSKESVKLSHSEFLNYLP